MIGRLKVLLSTHSSGFRSLMVGLLIGLLFLLPAVLGVEPPRDSARPFLWTKYLLPISCIAIFCVNYFVIVPRTLHRKSATRFLLINAALVALLLGMLTLPHLTEKNCPPHIREGKEEIMHPPVPNHDAPGNMESQRYKGGRSPFIRRPLVNFFFRDLLFMMLAVALAFSIRTFEEREVVKRRKIMSEANAKAFELKYLRMQLNPHFLFNTLNNIYALTSISAERAQKSILQLSAMLRYLIYEADSNEVPLKRELEEIQDYISLYKLRLEPTFRLSVNIGALAEGIKIPPLLFLTLVENAFKHCDKTSPEAFISISIAMDDEGYLKCEVKNSFAEGHSAGLKESETRRIESDEVRGVGLANVRQQLSLIYGSNASLSTKTEENVFTACISMRVKSPILTVTTPSI